MSGINTVCLVACVGQKASVPEPARRLYLSPWFIKASAYAERLSPTWFILSARHGLVAPDTMIVPYERTLERMDASAKKAWATMVKGQMAEMMPDADRIIVLAGRLYRRDLMAYLETRARSVEVPMNGLGIGEQLSWLNTALSR